MTRLVVGMIGDKGILSYELMVTHTQSGPRWAGQLGVRGQDDLGEELPDHERQASEHDDLVR